MCLKLIGGLTDIMQYATRISNWPYTNGITIDARKLSHAIAMIRKQLARMRVKPAIINKHNSSTSLNLQTEAQLPINAPQTGMRQRTLQERQQENCNQHTLLSCNQHLRRA
jgi:hypothetical protein